MKMKPDALAGLTSSDSFGLNLMEVVSQPSLLLRLLEALYAAASSCSARGHGGLQKLVSSAILCQQPRGHFGTTRQVLV